MTGPASRWERLEELFGEALARPADDRQGWLRSLTGEDAELRQELEALLTAYPRADVEIDRLRARIIGPEADARSIARAPSLAYVEPDGWLGRRIHQYRIVEHIGSGGMGVVYRAHDELLDRPVALKFIAPTFDWSERSKEQLLREARAGGALDHPNVCTIHEIGEDEDGHLFIVMPAYEGETLQQRIERGRLDDDEAIEVARAVAQALAVAHERGIVHGDVKPANIFLAANGGVKLLDFGLARVRATHATSGSRGGTARYMSPEQERGQPPDARSDVWMAGSTIAAMIGDDPRSTRPTAPANARPELLDLIRRSTQPEPSDRPADGAKLHSELEALRSPPAPPHRLDLSSPRRWLPRGQVALAALGVVVVAAAVVRGLAGFPPDPLVRQVLWVDDNPENNVDAVERLEGMGVEVTLAHSTEEALALWVPAMGVVVSDMGRYEGPDDTYVEQAGFDLLDAFETRDLGIRVAFCTSYRAAARYGEQARARGAEILTDCEKVTELVQTDR
jgi:serine/threonine-protein kinase